MKNAESLEAVHTHTHTHTHTHQFLFKGGIRLLDKCLIKTWLGFVAKEGKKEQEKSKFREGSLSKVASKKINQKQKENEYKWEKRVDCI